MREYNAFRIAEKITLIRKSNSNTQAQNESGHNHKNNDDCT
jgi:hypothetical protein